MKRANRLNARAAILIGEDELARGVGIIRDMDSGEQREASLANIENALATFREPDND